MIVAFARVHRDIIARGYYAVGAVLDVYGNVHARVGDGVVIADVCLKRHVVAPVVVRSARRNRNY